MKEQRELKKLIERKYIILDSNIFIKAYENPVAFINLFTFLRETYCEAVHFDFIRFEFTRNAYLRENRQAREEFLKEMAPTSLRPLNGIMDEALLISRIYAHRGIEKGQISLVDCYIAAYLKQYADNLFLITLNHKDFPTILFDRLYIFPVDANKDVLAPAFYQFNRQKWDDLNKKLAIVDS